MLIFVLRPRLNFHQRKVYVSIYLKFNDRLNSDLTASCFFFFWPIPLFLLLLLVDTLQEEYNDGAVNENLTQNYRQCLWLL